MADIREIRVIVQAQGAEQAANKVEKALGGAAEQAAKTNKNVSGLVKNLSAATQAISLMGGAFAGLAFTSVLQNTIQMEREQAQLAAVLKSTGEAAGYTRNQLNDMASAISAASTVSAGEINQAQTTLLAFTGIVGEEFTKSLQAATDMAARTGMSVVQAAETIGRALDIPSKGLTSLSKQGFRFTEDQKKLAEQLEASGRTAEAQKIILDALGESYGGAAKAARDTFGGSLTGLRNQLDDLMTGEDGSLDGAKDAVNELTRTLSSESTKAAFATFVSMIANATNAFATFMSTVNDSSFLGWIQVSGADAENAESEILKLEKSLSNMKATLQTFQEVGEGNSFMKWWNTDDVAILETQISSVTAKLETLRTIAKKNADDANKVINASVDSSGYGVGSLPPIIPKDSAPVIALGKSLKELLATYKTLVSAVDPATAKQKAYNENMANLASLTKLSDEELKKHNITRSELLRITERTTDAFKRERGIIAENIDSVNRQIALMGVSKEAREGEAAAIELVTKMKLEGLAVGKAEEAQLETYKNSIAELAQLRKEESFNENLNDRVQAIRDEIALTDVFGKKRERLAAQLGMQREAEKAGIRDVQGAVEKYMRSYDDLQNKIQESNTMMNGAKEAFVDYMEHVENVASTTRDAMSSVLGGLEDELAKFFRTGKFGMKDFLQMVNMQMSKLAAQQVIGLGLSIAGFRADGGPVSSGSTYVVGERGPELFTPQTSGTIVPNHMLNGAGGPSKTTTYAPQINLGGITVQGGNFTPQQASALADHITNKTMERVADELRMGGIFSR